MVTQGEAEKCAIDTVHNYLRLCGAETSQEIGDALMKLCSVTGVFMVSGCGYDNAVARMEGTTAFIKQTMQSCQVS